MSGLDARPHPTRPSIGQLMARKAKPAAGTGGGDLLDPGETVLDRGPLAPPAAAPPPAPAPPAPARGPARPRTPGRGRGPRPRARRTPAAGEPDCRGRPPPPARRARRHA